MYKSILDEPLYNTKIKVYPDGRTIICCANKAIFREPIDDDFRTGTEEDFSDDDLSDDAVASFSGALISEDLAEDPAEDLERGEHNLLRAAIRARDRIFDIAFANSDLWTHFLTLTIDPKKLDSKSVPDTMRRMGKWLDNMTQRCGIKYLLCPEYHFDGQKIHAHALIHAGTLELVDSGTRLVAGFNAPVSLAKIHREGLDSQVLCVVYNVPQWTCGFTTAVPIYGDGAALSFYVTKYITKNCCKIFGKYYWSSRGLRRDVETHYTNVDFSQVSGKAFEVPGAGLLLKYESGFNYVSG